MHGEAFRSKGASAVDGLPPERRRWAVTAIFMSVAMVTLDTAIANIALPAIAADLHASPADAVWVVNSYQMALVATMLPLAALGEIVGHSRVYLGGLLLFTLASLLCACAWSLDSLVIARGLQGLGAAGAVSVNTALVRFAYPARILGRGLGNNAMVVATAFTVGPTVASVILAFGPWQWLFAINIPFGLFCLLIALKTLPDTPRASHAFDPVGALLTAGCLGLIVLGIGSAAHKAVLPVVISELVAGLALGWLLLRRQADHPAPILPIDLFRRPVFALSAATALGSFTAQGLAFVALPFYLEDVLGRTQVETGFFMTPWPLVVGFLAPIAGRLSDRYPASVLCGIGLAVLSLGMALLALLPANPSVLDIVWRMAVCGFGFGLFQAPNLKALMSGAPAGRSGSASGIVGTARLIGQTTGAALAALCFALADREGATVALAVGAGFAVVGSVMSLLRLIAPMPES